MDFDLSDEHKAIRETVRRFAENEIAPISRKIEEDDLFPVELIRKMGDLGFLGLAYPEKYGGSGAGHLAHVIAVEEMNRVNSAASLMVCCVILSGMPLFLFGTEDQKERWLVPFIKGVSQCAFASTEPHSGSDAAGIRTRAVIDGDHWIINGTKSFITNAGSPLCRAVTITAVTGKREGGRNEISQIIVPTGTEGYTMGKNLKKIGWHGVDTRELFFEDCRVPMENLLGAKGAGLKQALTAMSMTRTYIAGMAVGLAQGCLDCSLRYAKERVAFGQTISKFQAIQFKLADMVTDIEAGRLLTYKYVVDRKKDMIISGAENIYSAEVENVLSSHPAVLEVAVIGVPDAQWGEAVKAIVVLREGMKATEEELIEHCKKHLASYKKPKSVEFIDALPRNVMGKVLKKELREKYWKGYKKRVH